MANERIKVNLIPGEEPAPIFHFSQYDNGRTFIAEMYNGEDPFDCDDYNVTLECRKRDNNLVIMTADTIDGNVITFHSIDQLCACYGDNDAEIVIRDANDLVIGSGNIIINVEKSPTCGGIQSDTVIENITEQIAQIVPEVIGDDYYNKTQTDDLLANKADISEIPDMDDYYTKSETQGLIANERTWTESQLENKADKATTYTKAQVNEILFNMLPIGQASGAIASFETEIAAKLTGLETTIVAQGGGGTPLTPIPIVGYSDMNLTRCGVNLCEELFTDGYVPSVSDGSLVLAGGSRTDFILVKPSTLYTFLIDDTVQMIYMFFYDENKNYISYTAAPDSTHTSFTATTPANCKYIMLRTQSSYVERGMLGEGTHTQYIPYNGQTFTVSIGQTVYGGVYDANAGKVTATQKAINFDDYTWEYNSQYNMWISTAGIQDGVSGSPLHCETVAYNRLQLGDNFPGTNINQTYNIWVRNGSSTITPSGLAFYELVTPFTIDLSSSDMLDAVVGKNNVFSDCGVTTARYKDSIQHYIDSRT